MRKFGKESAAPAKTGDEGRQSSGSGWFRNHWCLVSLCVIVVVAFLLRTVFVYGLSAGGGFALSGGSSAQNHLHVVESILNGTFAIGTDAAVNYPLGGLNVVPPLMDYFAAAVAGLLGMFGMSTTEAASAALAVLPPIIGALTCIPVYAVGKELYDKRIGVVAALIFAFLALPISSSVFSNGTEYALTAFLIACMSLFLIRTVKMMESDAPAKKVYLNSLLCGIYMGLIALAWNGFGLMVLIVGAPMLLQIVVDRVKGKDFTVTLIGHSLTLLVGIALAAVYYIPAGLMEAVFSGPLLLAILVVIFGFLFKALASRPWITVIPVLFGVLAVVLVALFLGAPDLFNALVYGNPIYVGTMADLVMDHVSMSNVSSYYGWLTMWLPICLALYETYVYFKEDRSARQLFLVTWLYLMFFAVWSGYGSAAVVGTVFAVASAAVIVQILVRADLREWVKSIRIAGFPSGFRKLIKPFPLASVLITALLVIAPNFTYAVDAGMSNNTDGDHFFSGNTQFVVKTGDSYPVGNVWDEYADQDKDGAAVIWLDYVADAVAQGNFSTIADSYGEGAEATAQMMLANGSEGMMAAMMVRLIMSGDINDYNLVFPTDVFNALKSYIEDPAKAQAAIADDPEAFGDVRGSISDENAVYLACIDAITCEMDQVAISKAYDKVRANTGEAIDYVILDTSLLPISYGGGDSFTSIAYFAGYDTDSYGAIPEFFSYNTSYGYTTYTDEMYETFLWKALIGPSAKDAGFSSSYSYLYSLALSDGSTIAQPGDGLAGFEVAFWQVMYNADPKATAASDGWEYMPIADAVAKQKADGGLINYLSSMVVLEYVGIDSYIHGTLGADSAGLVVEVYDYDALASAYRLVSYDVTDATGAYTVADGSLDAIYVVKNGSVTLASSMGSVPDVSTIDKASGTATIMVGTEALNASGASATISNVTTGDVVATYPVSDLGKVQFDGLVPGEYTMTVRNAADVALTTATITLAPGVNEGLEVVLTTYNITVTVKDTNGMLIEGMGVIATESSTGAVYKASSEDDGKAVIAVLPGSYTISAEKPTASFPTVTVSKSNTTSSIVVTEKVFGADEMIDPGFPVFAYAGPYSYQLDDMGYAALPFTYATGDVLYSVYGTDGVNALLGVYMGGTDIVYLNETAYKVSGTTTAGATVAFVSTNTDEGIAGATVKAVADSEGRYSAYLINGTYTVHADNGKDKAYLGTITVDGADIADKAIELVDGRVVSMSVKYQSGTSSGYINQPFVYVQADIVVEDVVTYTLYGMTDSSGKATFVIPDNLAVNLYAGSSDGTFENDSFKAGKLSKTVTSGTSDSSNTVYIYNKDVIGEEPKEDDNYVKPVIVNTSFNVELTYYSDKDRKYFVQAGTDTPIIPGQYTARIDTGGHYYDGPAYVYPGLGHIMGLEPVDAVKVTMTKDSKDIITIEHEGGEYWRDGDTYWFKVLDEDEHSIIYTIKSVNTAGEEKKVKYANLNTGGSIPATIDMTATTPVMEVSGNVGIDADGTITVMRDDVELVFDVKDGQYTMELPNTWTDVEVDVEVKSDSYGYSTVSTVTGFALTGLTDKAIRNIPVITTGYEPSDETDLRLQAQVLSYDEDGANFRFTLTGGYSNVTYLLTPGDAMTFGKVVSLTSGDVIEVYAYFTEKDVSLKDEGMTFTVSDINGEESLTIHAPLGIVDDSCVPEISVEANDLVTASQYRYAVTVDNSGNYNSVSMMVTVDNVVDGVLTVDGKKWFVTLYNKMFVASSGDIFEVPANDSEFTVYICLMSADGTGQVPDITINVTAGDATPVIGQVLKAQSLDLTVEDMSVSGGDSLNTRSGIPMGVWFMLAVGLILIVATFYLASKRGVFSRRR